MATMMRPWRPIDVIHQITVWSPDIRKTLLSVTAIGTVLCSHGALTRDLCEPNCVSTMTSASVWRSYHDLMASWKRAQCDHRRPYSDTYGVDTKILRQPAAFRCIFGSIPWQARMFSIQLLLTANTSVFFILKRNHDFIKVWSISFQISYNVNHKVMNGQYWKLHMTVLFRSSWYKYHTSFRFYLVIFCYW